MHAEHVWGRGVQQPACCACSSGTSSTWLLAGCAHCAFVCRTGAAQPVCRVCWPRAASTAACPCTPRSSHKRGHVPLLVRAHLRSSCWREGRMLLCRSQWGCLARSSSHVCEGRPSSLDTGVSAVLLAVPRRLTVCSTLAARCCRPHSVAAVQAVVLVCCTCTHCPDSVGFVFGALRRRVLHTRACTLVKDTHLQRSAHAV